MIAKGVYPERLFPLGECKMELVTREELRLRYDGYEMRPGKRLYNPCSIVGALRGRIYECDISAG